MRYPNFNEEKKLWKKGYKYVVGLDEAGRGPLAGPVVAAAVIINPKPQTPKPNQIPNHKILKRFWVSQNWGFVGHWALEFEISGVRDSKKLSEKQRERIYEKLTVCPVIEWGIGIVSEKIIDKINILEATKLAMKKAVLNLEKKLFGKPYIITHDRSDNCKLDFLILDGNFVLQWAQGGKNISQKSIIKADEKVFSAAAASIIAKVTRDRIMKKEHKKYPQYGFYKHKGYGTKAHFASLKKFGPCKIHRKTFYPVSGIMNLS